MRVQAPAGSFINLLSQCYPDILVALPRSARLISCSLIAGYATTRFFRTAVFLGRAPTGAHSVY